MRLHFNDGQIDSTPANIDAIDMLIKPNKANIKEERLWLDTTIYTRNVLRTR